MRVLVTGGAGFIGSHLVERLCRNRCEVVVIDNLHSNNLAHLDSVKDHIHFCRVDIRDPGALGEAMRGGELLYHLAAQSSVLGAVEDVEYSCTTNVVGTLNVLREARAAGVRRVVFTSSREVYGEPKRIPVRESATLRPKNVYGASKAAAEMYCRVLGGEGLETVILRLANVYGTRDKNRVIPIFAENALRGEPLVLYGGEQLIDFVHVDIVVDALLKAGFGDFIEEPLNIGSGQGTSIIMLARRVLRLTRSRSRIEKAPVRQMEVAHFVADIARSRRRLRLKVPADPLHRLREVLEWTRGKTTSGASWP